MPYEFSIQVESGYIRVEVSGEHPADQPADELLPRFIQVAELCRRKGTMKVLAVMNTAGQIAASEVLYAVGSAPGQGWDTNIHLALVIRDAERLNKGRLAEKLATNRGLQVRAFDNEASGKEWLFCARK